MADGNNSPRQIEGAICPLPLTHSERIVMGHGSGGKMAHDLIGTFFMPPFDNAVLRAANDAGIVSTHGASRIAISTDSHVVWPLFFPGGDIGRLAVCGTVNDLSMMGATPLYLTAGFILEEGLEISVLQQVVASMQAAAEEASIQIIAGDTKVVQRGKADGLYINTAGVGILPEHIDISGDQARPGDIIILSGPVGDHGIAVLQARGDLGFETDIQSDVAPLNHLVALMLETTERIHVLRDPTRGGVATTLNEIARQSHVGIVLDETNIPVRNAVTAASELLGFDPLYIANEGRLLAFVHPEDASVLLTAMQTLPQGKEAVVIGQVQEKPPGRVLMRTAIGSMRVVEMPAGELLPRIC